MERTGEYLDASSRTLDYRGQRDLFSQESIYQAWLDIEAAVATVQAEMGLIPRDAAETIAATCRLQSLDMDKVEQDYARMRHPLMPLLGELSRKCGEAGRYVHWGLATQNIQQTGTLYLLQRGHRALLGILRDILSRLGDLALEHADTPMAGRTHGQHAVPITLGFKFAIWIDELLQAEERLRTCEPRVFTVTMGGAVGAYTALGQPGPEMQRRVAARLGMYDMSLPSRSNRTHMCEYVQILALTGSTFHKIADEIAQSSSVEYGELFEAFSDGIIGSSTMPQKVNPKLSMGLMANCQKLYSLSGMLLGTAHRPFEGDAYANVIFDSGTAEAMELALAIFARGEALVSGLTPDADRMLSNLQQSEGRIFSEGIMMKLAPEIGRNAAHDLVYDAAMASRRGSHSFFGYLQDTQGCDILFEPTAEGPQLKSEGQYGLSPQIARDFAQRAHERTAHSGASEIRDSLPKARGS